MNPSNNDKEPVVYEYVKHTTISISNKKHIDTIILRIPPTGDRKYGKRIKFKEQELYTLITSGEISVYGIKPLSDGTIHISRSLYKSSPIENYDHKIKYAKSIVDKAKLKKSKEKLISKRYSHN